MRVLLGTDGSPSAGVAIDLVGGMDWPPGTAIQVVEAIQDVSALVGDPWSPLGMTGAADYDAEALAAAHATVEEACSHLDREGVEVSCAVVRGRAATALVDSARSSSADVVVVGSRGHGTIDSMLLGSVSSEVVDHAPVPVLVARRPIVRQVVFAWDGSDCARAAAKVLETWPVLRGTAVRVVSVAHIDFPWWTGFPGGAAQLAPMSVEAAEASRRHHAELADAMARELTALGIPATAESREGDPAAEIIAAADACDADLILVGTHGRTGLRRLFLGSVARNVLHHADASVLVARDTACRPDDSKGDPA
jgi:nucleotide-binding universal stress UspA family protein